MQRNKRKQSQPHTEVGRAQVISLSFENWEEALRQSKIPEPLIKVWHEHYRQYTQESQRRMQTNEESSPEAIQKIMPDNMWAQMMVDAPSILDTAPLPYEVEEHQAPGPLRVM